MRNEIILDGYKVITRKRVEENLELVVGHKSNQYSQWACWYCKDGDDYFWGEYSFDDPDPVFKKYRERLESYLS